MSNGKDYTIVTLCYNWPWLHMRHRPSARSMFR